MTQTNLLSHSSEWRIFVKTLTELKHAYKLIVYNVLASLEM